MNENKKNLAIIGASYLQLPLIQKAKEMGFTTHVFAWEAGDPGEAEADVFHPVSIVERKRILEECRKAQICAICSIASDLAMLTVNYVASEMGLPGNSPECTRMSTNKYEMRKAFEKHKIPSCKSRLIENGDELQTLIDSGLSYPKIVKPTDRSGSRGIFLVDNEEELKSAVRASASCSFEKKVLVEDYIPGKEYSVECISQEGVHYLLAVTEKITTGAPRFIERGHNEPSGLDDREVERVREVVFRALDALQITTGASHSEIRIDDDGRIRIIEIGGRMGGDCIGSHLVRLSTGYDYVRMVIESALGLPLSFQREKSASSAHVRFIFDGKDVEEYERLRDALPPERFETLFFHPGDLDRTEDSSSRAGCYLYWTPTAADEGGQQMKEDC